MNPKERGIKLLDAIIEGKQHEAFQLLRDGADLTVQRKGDYAIHMAARTGNLDIIKELKVDLDLRNVHGNTPAHYAATGGFVHLIQFLRSKGVSLNASNDYGHTPLHDAVIQQPMDVLESFIELGMDPNKPNPRTGETPAHVACMFGRRMAIEALIVKGANLNAKDNCHRKPADVAKDRHFRQIVRMYETKAAAFGTCAIWAAGMKLTNASALQETEIERVGIILKGIHHFNAPKHNPASFYCRRENSEEASVPLKQFEDEHVFSDVFFILVSNSSVACMANILLPLHSLPSEKEELVLRFISGGEMDRPINDIISIEEVFEQVLAECQNNLDPYQMSSNKLGIFIAQIAQTYYVYLQAKLMPEATCICLICSRPKEEHFVIANEGGLIELSMEPEFSLDVPPGAFDGDTMFAFKVFESQDLNVKSKKTGGRTWGMKPQSCPLLTSVFDIKLSGQQPKKAITVQMPVTGDTYQVSEFVVLRVEDDRPLDANTDVLPVKPKFINNNLIFTTSHFSTYVAVPRERIATEKDIQIIEKHISHARERRKPATFFAALKHIEGLSFILLVDFGLASKFKARSGRWKEEGFKLEKPSNESEAFMVLPKDEFFADIRGQAKFEDRHDAKEQKFCFSACRNSCNQTFRIQLDQDATDSETGYGEVVIYRPSGPGEFGHFEKEVCRLRVTLPVSEQEKPPLVDQAQALNQTNPTQNLKSNQTPNPRYSIQSSISRQSLQTPLTRASSQMSDSGQQRYLQERKKQTMSANVHRAKRTITLLSNNNMLSAQIPVPKPKADVRPRQIEPCQGKAYISAHRNVGRSKTTL